ncbi:uncharacterized protein B0T15DRAFT_512168 [Chaetomium strumarium]|uniref:Uncharacterized protein n=1 Tax=Chaetomium strumarium TaxID=1170767 RepID=A0AAJ0GQC1_9PEZI|nr:hypothetical protein B0T15DRAFT_512168 [Chaetomium strumarium]
MALTLTPTTNNMAPWITVLTYAWANADSWRIEDADVEGEDGQLGRGDAELEHSSRMGDLLRVQYSMPKRLAGAMVLQPSRDTETMSPKGWQPASATNNDTQRYIASRFNSSIFSTLHN